jgi:hypothetical protein
VLYFSCVGKIQCLFFNQSSSVRLKQIANGIVVCDNLDGAKSNYLAEVEHPFPFNVQSSPETAFSSSLYYDCRTKQKMDSHMLGM